MLQQFKMPDVGEGLTEADVLRWMVQPGDTVAVNQIIVEVETAKAAVELPSPWAGVVKELHAAEGETVDVGTPIITIDVGGEAGATPAAAAPAQAGGAAGTGSATESGTATDSGAAADSGSATEDLVPAPQGEAAAGGRQPVLVGYGPRHGSTGRRARKPRTPAPGETPSANRAFNVPPAPNLPPAPSTPPVPSAPNVPSAPSADDTAGARHRVLAKPPVRKLAKTLGVDLGSVEPTGPHGTVTRADIEQAASTPATAPRGRETRIPIKGVRKHTAAAMVSSAFTAPHVTEFVTVDVTPTMELRERVAARREFRDVKLSPLAFVARAVILAAKRTPEVNASWDDAAGEIVLKHYVNLGIAAATDRGLIVPNIKDADQLSLLELAKAIGALTELARSGKTPPADMTGGTITITNVGVFGVDTGTPIINPGESAIVAFGAVRRMPWVVDEQIVPRWVTQLAVSFDHRLVDGQQGSQFLADVAGTLADPGLALL